MTASPSMPAMQQRALAKGAAAMPSADAGQPYALRVSDVGKTYDSGFSVSEVTFDLPLGYIMGLIGPNGAGKSTLIKLILNMVKRDTGSIEVLGLDNIADEEAVKTQLGVVFDTNFFPEYWSVNLVEHALSGMYKEWDAQAFSDYLERFGISERKKSMRQLSRGMQMKVMLAAAMSHGAKLLILDEPTSGLDVLSRDELMDILSAYIEDERHSVLFSTHITGDLELSADFITYISSGSLFYTGPKDEFEDSFRVLKGGPDATPVQEADWAVGVTSYATGCDVLVRTDKLAQAMNCIPGAVVEPASIDNIIRLTNDRRSRGATNGTQDEHAQEVAR